MVDIQDLHDRLGRTLPVSDALWLRHDPARFLQRQELEIR